MISDSLNLSLIELFIVGSLFVPLTFIFLLFCLNNPFWLIAALAIYLPFEEFVLKWVPDILYTPLRFLGEITILIVVVALLLKQFLFKKKWPKTPIDLPIVILLFAMIISAAVNHVPLFVFGLGVKNIFRYILLFYLIILSKPSEKEIVKLLKVLLTVALIQAAIAVFQSIIGKPAFDFLAARDVIIGDQLVRSGGAEKLALSSYRTLVFSTMGRYNVLGNYIAFWLGLCLALIIPKKNIIKIRPIYLGLLFLALLLSYSRMSWVAFLIGIPIIFLYSKKYKIFIFIFSGVLLCFTVWVWLFIGGTVDTVAVNAGVGNPITRFIDLLSTDYLKISFSAGRGYSYFSIAPALLKVKPIFGFGPGMIASDVTNLFSITSVADRLSLDNPYALLFLGDAGFVTILAQMGLIGVLAILLIFVQLFRIGFNFQKKTNSYWKPIAVGYIVILVMMVFFNLVGFALIYRVPSYYFWMFSAFIVLQYGRENNIAANKSIVNVKS